MILQILVTIFALFALSRSYLRLRKGTESLGAFLFWTITWIGVIIVVFFPEITTFIANLLGVGRGIDVFVYVGIVILFYSTYRIYAKLEDMQKSMTDITREIAIQKAKKKK